MPFQDAVTRSRAASGALVSWCMLPALAAWLAAAPAARAQVEANPFLNDSVIQQIYLTVGQSDWSTLLANYESDNYYPATFTWNGMVEEAGIRQHGNTTRSPIKPNLDVNFAYYSKKQTFLGLPFILLKANNDDPTNLHEWISMKLYRMMGFPGLREAPAQLYVNGQYFGFYMITEHISPTFLERNFGESGGYLYEWEFGDNYEFQVLGTDPSVYAPFLKLKSDQAAPDLQTFANLVQAINQPLSPTFTADDYIASISQYIDPKSFLTYAATENALAEADGLVGGVAGMNSFYLYQYQGTTFYQLIPWDKGLTFSNPTRDVLTGFTLPPNVNILAQRLEQIPEYLNFYLGQVSKAAALLGDINGWAAREVEFEYNLIDSAASNDPNKQCMAGAQLYSCGAADFQNGIQDMYAFLDQRADFVQQEVQGYGFQPVATDPQIQGAAMTAPAAPQNASAPFAPFGSQAAPGSWLTLTVANFSGGSSATGSPLPRSLANVYVAVEGVRAPLIATSAGQIELQMPGDLPPGAVNIVVCVGGEMSNTLQIPVQGAIPSILGVAHQADGSAVTADHPAQPGEILTVYAAGLGALSGDFPFGTAAPADPPVSTFTTPQLTLASAPLTVLFSGLAPNYVGLYQVTALMPQSLPSGSAASLTVGGSVPFLDVSAPLPLANQ